MFGHIEYLGFIRFNEVMYQRIHETIRVAGVHEHSNFKPVWFDWRKRQYRISQITLVSDFKQGGIKQKIYSVKAEGNIYRLTQDLSTQEWFLSSVWVD